MDLPEADDLRGMTPHVLRALCWSMGGKERGLREDLLIEAILRRREEKRRYPLRNLSWWGALRDLRRIPSFSLRTDESILRELGRGEPLSVTEEDLRRSYEENSEQGTRRIAGVPRPLTKRELIVELGKVPRLGGRTKEYFDEYFGEYAIPEKIEKYLNDEGGPSSSDPEADLEVPRAFARLRLNHPGKRDLDIVLEAYEYCEGEDTLEEALRGMVASLPEPGWWDAMRSLRTLERAHEEEDDLIVALVEHYLRIEPGRAGPEDLLTFFVAYRGEGTSEVAGVPEELTIEEIVTELRKFPRFAGMDEDDIWEEAGVPDLRELLDEMGGPSSSSPNDDSMTRSEALEALRGTRRFTGRSNAEIYKAISNSSGEEIVSNADLAYVAEEDAEPEDEPEESPYWTPPPTWREAIARARTLAEFWDAEDEEILATVERSRGLAPGTAAAKDIDGYTYESRTAARTAPSASSLTREAALVHAARHPAYEGLGLEEVEARVPKKGRSASTEEVVAHLSALGGPQPRGGYDARRAMETLRETDEYFGDAAKEIARKVEGATLEADDDEYARTLRELHTWGLKVPEARPVPLRTPSSLLRKLGEGGRYEGMSPEEIIDEIEGVTGRLVELGDIERALKGESLSGPRGRPPRGRGWWDVMRKIRTLTHGGSGRDEDIEKRIEGEFGEVTEESASRYYELMKRRGGIEYEARIPTQLTRRETLIELSKFARYEGMTLEEVEEAVPGKKKIANTKNLRRHLRDLGGPSSSSPDANPTFWETMRKLRSIERFQGMEDDEIVEEAGGRDLEELFKEHRGSGLDVFSRAPREPSREEILRELSALPRYGGRREDDDTSTQRLMSELNLFGGPASSSGRRRTWELP